MIEDRITWKNVSLGIPNDYLQVIHTPISDNSSTYQNAYKSSWNSRNKRKRL